MKIVVYMAGLMLFASAVGAQQNQLTNDRIVSLIKSGTSDRTIISLISQFPDEFDASPKALTELRDVGASNAVINEIKRCAASQPPVKSEQNKTPAKDTPLVQQTEKPQPMIRASLNRAEAPQPAIGASLGGTSIDPRMAVETRSSTTRTPLSLKELRTKGAVLQSLEYSCGAAALATLMGLMGEPATEAQVLDSIFGKELPTFEDKKDGKVKLRALTVADLEKGARKAGFKVVSVQVPDPGEAEKVLYFFKPAIARMVLYNDYLHFVVLRDMEDGWVYVTDPGYGNFKITWKQFHEAWKAGDQIFLTIGQHPFYAWEDKKSKQVYLKRNEQDSLPIKEQIAPWELFQSAQQGITQMGAIPR